MEPLPGRPLLLGHRGCRGAHPENTFAAFEYALASGCDGFEFDVRTTADQYLVLVHDPKHAGRKVADHSYAVLHERRRRFRREVPSDPLAYLDEMLERFASEAWLDIELKVTGIEQRVVEMLQRYRPRGFVISSFLPGVITNCHAIDPKLPLGLICKYKSEVRPADWLPITHLMPHHRLVTAELVKRFHDEGRKVMTWTVNDPQEMRRVAECGVDGVISDDPVLLAKVLGS